MFCLPTWVGREARAWVSTLRDPPPPKSSSPSPVVQLCAPGAPGSLVRKLCPYIIRYSSGPAGPKLQKLKKAACALLSTSSLRQRLKCHCHCFSHQHPSLGINRQSSVRVALEIPQSKVSKISTPRTLRAKMVCVESICNSTSLTKNEDEFFLIEPERIWLLLRYSLS